VLQDVRAEEIAAGAAAVVDAEPEGEAPPLAGVGVVDGLAGRREHQPAGLEHLRQGAGIVLGSGGISAQVT
jgi:hypothetical protein